MCIEIIEFPLSLAGRQIRNRDMYSVVTAHPAGLLQCPLCLEYCTMIVYEFCILLPSLPCTEFFSVFGLHISFTDDKNPL